ncbi:MAG: response regulator [Alphaproteobacteria bacterium]|nr:response regulator [Alphaproteobacteria bacterium]
MRILVVDDDPLFCELLTLYLANKADQVDAVSDGEACLENVRQEPTDMVFLDLRMPGMDGYATVRELKAQWPSLAIVGVTAETRPTHIRAGFEAGFDFFLTKPVDPEQVRALVEATRIGRPPISALQT